MSTTPATPTRSWTNDGGGGPFARLDWVLFGTIAGIWGSTNYFTEIALRGFSPMAIAASRVVIGLFVLAAACRFLPPAPAAGPMPRALVVELGLVWMTLPLVLIPMAQEHVTSSVAGIATGSQPLFAAVIAAVMMRRMPSVTVMVGLAAGFAGITLLAGDRGVGGVSVLGVTQALGASACYALSVNLVVPLQQRFGAVPVVVRVQAVAAVMLLGLAAATGAEVQLDLSAVLAVIVLGAAHTGLAYVVMATLVGRVGGARGSAAVYLVPFVAVLLGTLLLREAAPPGLMTALLLVTAGTVLTGQGARLARRRA